MKNREFGGERPPQPPENPKPKSVGRRTFIKRGLQVAAGAGVGAWVGKEFIDSQIENRTADIAQLTNFLRGLDKRSIEMFGKSFNHEAFVKLTGSLLEPKRETPRVTAALLDSFTYMMEVEDQFGGRFNTLPLLEKIDRVTEPLLDTASSFGYGQINAQTARGIALEKSEQLVKQGLVSEEQINRLRSNDVSEHEIVDILDLSGNGNIPISFLYFYKGYDQYGRTTQGKVHGISETEREKGRLSADRKTDPRAFGLAVSAYSAKLESPMVAKAQTYINEMLLADPALKTGLDLDKPLETDGDLGPNTLRILNEVSQKIGIRSPFAQGETTDRLSAMDTWLAGARNQWNRRLDGWLKTRDKNPEEVKEVVSHRYHGVASLYNLLTKMFPDRAEQVREQFLAFADTRQADFVNLIDDRQKFENQFGSQTYDRFYARLNQILPSIISYDERYRGYIPMGYAAPSRSFADPKNIMMRVLMAHESDSQSTINIPLN